MTRSLRCTLLASLFTVAGCGTTGLLAPPEDPAARFAPRPASPPQARHAATEARDSFAAPPVSVAAPPKPTAPPSSDGYRLAPAEPSPQTEMETAPPLAERPGLATVFGETRTSRVHDVAFQRASGPPLAVATVYYNDRAGAEAMAAADARRAGHLDAAVAMRGGITVSVVDEGGAPFDAFALGGRVYVVGEVGRRYSLVLHNQTGRRYEVVASVDGLDIVDGQPASVGKRGYLIDPWGTVTVDGFRRNLEEVAAFRFGPVSGSYAARTAGDRNVGVIGVALFDEQGASAFSDDEIDRRLSAQPFADKRFARPPL